MTLKNLAPNALKIGGYGMVLWIFAIYFSTALAIICSALLLLLWLVSGQYRQLTQILTSYTPAAWSCALFACLLLGLSYSDAPHADAMEMLKKYRELLFIPLLLPFLSLERYRQLTWWAIFAASVITVIGSELISLKVFCLEYQCLPYFKSYITHGILIAFFSFFLAHQCLNSQNHWRWLYAGILVFCLYNLFFIGQGRTGQLLTVVLALLFFLQRLSKQALLVSVLTLSLVLTGFIGFSGKGERFKEGFMTLKSRLSGSEQGEFSAGKRLTFWQHSAQLIAEKPLLGQGTGNFAQTYQRISGEANKNPHNEFLLIGVQLGIFGLAVYLGFLFSVYQTAKQLPKTDKWLTQGVATSLIVTSLFNSPLLDHTEGHWFTTLIALCIASCQKDLTKGMG